MNLVSHISTEYINLLKKCQNLTIKNIYLKHSYIFSSNKKQKRLDYDSEFRIYIEFEEFSIEIFNDAILLDDYDEYCFLGIQYVDMNTLVYETDYYKILPSNIHGKLEDIKIVNDTFTTWDSDDIRDIDIALKLTIAGKVYYIVLWDSFTGEISWIPLEGITDEEHYKVRDRLTNYWIAKAPDLRYFHRKEKELSECISL